MHLVIELSDLLVVGIFVVSAYYLIRAFVSYCVSHPEALLPAAQEFYKGLKNMDAARNREEWGAGLHNAINRGNWNNYDEPPEDERARYRRPIAQPFRPFDRLVMPDLNGQGGHVAVALPHPAGIFCGPAAPVEPDLDPAVFLNPTKKDDEKSEGGNETDEDVVFATKIRHDEPEKKEEDDEEKQD